MRHFTELNAWKNGIQLAKEVHHLTKLLPSDERFGMIQQLRKCSGSILANIAEGFGRFTYPDKAAKYTISRGECSETEAHLHVAVAFEYLKQEQIEKALKLVTIEGKLLSGLISACRQRESES